MAKLGNLYLDGKFPISTNRLNHFDRLFGQALFGGVEKSVDFSPIISVSDALAKPAIDLQCKITAVQEGSGDPSPTNIRPITGFTGLSVFRGSSVSVENKEIVISAVQSGEGNPSPTNIRPISAGLTIEMDDSTTLEVYGGSLNPVTGKMTITHDIYIPIGNEYTVQQTGRVAFKGATRFKAVGTKEIICSDFANTLEAGDYFYVPTSMIASDLMEYFRENDVQFCGFLATPQEIQLSQTELARALTALGVDSIPVTWQTEAGTVYGGVVDLTTGGLTVTHVIYAFTGEEDIAYGTYLEHGRFFANVLTGQKSGTNVPLFCSHYKPSTAPVYANNADNNICANNAFLYWRDDSITSGADMETYLATQYANGTPVTVVYELATPQTYTLTPQAVQLLAGNNTIWNTTGDIRLTYMAKK